MSRDGSGNFTYPAATLGTPGSVIESAKYNAMVGETATGLSESINKAGTVAFIGNQSMGGNRLTNLADGTQSANAASVSQVRSGIVSHASAVAGGVNAIELTFSPTFSAYTDYMRIRWTSGGANSTTSPTIEVDGMAAKNLRKFDNQAVAAGDTGPSGYECEAVYDGTRFLLLNPYNSALTFAAGAYTPNATGGDKGADTINAVTYYNNGVAMFSEVIKASSETVSGSTSLQADDELTFAMAANTRYEFEFSLYYDTTAAADFKFDLDSSGSTDPGDMNIAIEYLAPAATAWVSTVYTTLNNVISITAGAGSGQIKIGGYAANGADAGSLRVRWAQNTSDPGNTVVRRSSSLRYRVT